MSRLPAIQTEAATGKAKTLLEGIQAKLKITPNMMRVMANSPAVLQGYLSFSGALAGGVLDAKVGEQIALAVGEQNACQYCVSAHTALGKMAGLSDSESDAARSGHSASPKVETALHFAHELVRKKGQIAEPDFAAVRAAGWNDAEMAEIIAHVALNIFTNYFNNATEVEVGFPKIAPRASA